MPTFIRPAFTSFLANSEVVDITAACTPPYCFLMLITLKRSSYFPVKVATDADTSFEVHSSRSLTSTSLLRWSDLTTTSEPADLAISAIVPANLNQQATVLSLFHARYVVADYSLVNTLSDSLCQRWEIFFTGVHHNCRGASSPSLTRPLRGWFVSWFAALILFLALAPHYVRPSGLYPPLRHLVHLILLL